MSSSASERSTWLIFLDIDGVLNRLEVDEEEERKKRKKEKKQQKKQKKERADEESQQTAADSSPPISADLPEVASVEHIQQLLNEAGLSESIDAALLQNLLRLLHSIPHEESSAASCAIVLTSTWRLQAESLAQLTKLFTSLDIVVATGSASTSSSWQTQILCTPDLKGWGSRLEEITAFLQSCDAKQLERSRMLLIDDMDLFAGQHHDDSSLHHELKARTIQLDGFVGLDASGLEWALRLLRTAAPLSREALSAVSSFRQPEAPL
jgi:hypothetical protein